MTIGRALKTELCRFIGAILFAFPLAGCDDDDKGNDDENACSLETGEGCAEGMVCEETTYGEEGQSACFAPVVIRGRVFDLLTDEGVPDALVVARDSNGAAMGAVAVSGADGTYALTVATKRVDEEGGFEGAVLTLRVDAEGYASYPGGFRPSLPVDLDEAQPLDSADEEGPSELTVQSSTTDVALIPLKEDAAVLGTISGTAPFGFGALIVAESSPSTVTGVADGAGNYTIFNVPAGTYGLSAYASGKQYASFSVDIAAGEQVTGADFSTLDNPLATVSGSVNIVNAPGGSMTSVVLVVEATFNDTFKRGEMPPGLRAGEVTGAFTIEDVPDGKYVVLAAFENDAMVRDPDTSIGGTQIVHIETQGGTVTVPESFKVTEALELKSPGAEAPEAVTGNPSFVWADDSSEDAYAIVVYDAFGQTVWENDSIDRVTGSKWVTLEYGGPQLEEGLYYQWRVTSLHKGVPISTTEDLRGLFFLVM